MDIERRLHAEAQRRIAPSFNGGYPPLLVWYCRHAPILVDDAGRATLPVTADPRLLDAAAKLGPLCDFLILGSNGVDQLRAEVARAAGKPVVSIIEATLAEVRRRQWRRVGVIALGGGAIYVDPLTAAGVACEIPYAAANGRIAAAVFATMEGRADAAASAVIRDVVNDLRNRGVDGIILGCTEVPLLLGDEADTAADLINPNQMLAQAAIAHAIA